MTQSIHRRTTIERLSYDPRTGRRPGSLTRPMTVACAVAGWAAVPLDRAPLAYWLMWASLVAGVVLWVLAGRPASTPGGVDVHTSAGTITASSHRSAVAYPAVALLVWGIPLALAIAGTAIYGFDGGLHLVALGVVLPAVGIVLAVLRLVVSLGSVDLRLDAGGLHTSAPLLSARTLTWDEIGEATSSLDRLTLALASGGTVALNIRLQRTDHTVLAEIITRCAEHPIARERLGDVILGDLLLNAAPDGTEPEPTPTRDWS